MNFNDIISSAKASTPTLTERDYARIVSAAIGLGTGAFIAAGATKVVLSSTVIPGSIASAPVILNGVPMFICKVSASLAFKLVLGIATTVIVYGVCITIYDAYKASKS